MGPRMAGSTMRWLGLSCESNTSETAASVLRVPFLILPVGAASCLLFRFPRAYVCISEL